MRTQFWRFAYDEDLLDEILASDQLYFPNLKLWPRADNNSIEKIVADLKSGYYILLANFDMNTELGTVRGVGKVIEIRDGHAVMHWKKPIPRWSLTPDRQGGVEEWRKEGVFCFDVAPAKRYKLDALTKKLFQNA